jgi:hypothetical protein
LAAQGILATVAAGMYIGEQRSTLVPAGTRLHATSFLGMIVFLLNGTLFLMAGIELRNVMVHSSADARILTWGITIGFTVAGVRFLWYSRRRWSLSRHWWCRARRSGRLFAYWAYQKTRTRPESVGGAAVFWKRASCPRGARSTLKPAKRRRGIAGSRTAFRTGI